MKCPTLSALFFAASIALAIAVPARNYYYDDEYPESRHLTVGRPVSLASAPFYYQSRHLELDELPDRARKYQIVKRKKRPGAPAPQGGSDEDDDAADDDESNESSEEDEEEDDENAGEDHEEESADVPPWEDLFPEDDKNTGSFQDQPSSGYGGGQGGPPEDMQGGGRPAPQSGSQSLLSLLTGGSSKPQNEGQGEQGGYGGPGGPQGGYGGPGGPQGGYGGSGGPQGGPQGGYGGPGGPQGGGPGGPQYRHALMSSEEPRSGAAVLYSPHTDRYIPVRPVQVRVPKRTAKKVKKAKKVTPQVLPEEEFQGRSLRPVSSSKKTGTKTQYVLMPVERDNREIRFGRDRHSLRVDSGPVYPPTDIWRWGGRSGKPTGLYYAPRPHRGSASSIRFVAPENDY